jgi:hypothetical protein
MDNPTLIVVGAIVMVAVAIGIWFYLRERRTEQLRSQFGPEYDYMVREQGDQRRAEKVLEMRQRRAERFATRRLSAADRKVFVEQWLRAQAHFVDAPRGAVAEADVLASELLNVRGYPLGNFEQRVEDLSVHHPHVVENYRRAHEIALRSQGSQSSTEDLRTAIVCYRTLFDELLGDVVEPLRKAS